MIKAGLGYLLLALGVSTIDSEHLIIPLALTIIGSVLLLVSSKEISDEE